MKSLSKILGVLLIVLGMVGGASALEFTVDVVAISANSGDGLLISTDSSPYIPHTTTNLSVGQNEEFNLFNIWTDEGWVNEGEDTIPKTIEVDLSFLLPPSVTGNPIEGDTTGITEFYGFYQAGQVIWDGPETFNFEGGGVFTVSLSDVVFNEGWGWLGPGCTGATVQANLSYETAPVPEPGTMLLLGAGLIGIAGASRKKIFKKK